MIVTFIDDDENIASVLLAFESKYQHRLRPGGNNSQIRKVYIPALLLLNVKQAGLGPWVKTGLKGK